MARGETVDDKHAAVRIHKRSVKWTPLTKMLISNGCELSGRGVLAHILPLHLLQRSSLALGAESPVRSSELLAGMSPVYRSTPQVSAEEFDHFVKRQL